MNKMRRRSIFKITEKISQILISIKEYSIDQLLILVDEIKDFIQDILDDEECAMDNTPENLQNSQRYEESEYACENLLDSIDALEDLDEDSTIEDIKQCLDDVISNLSNCI